jgi:alkanesulfonate monooxygenase SsuD/methylene tetrahydromethanopterin reductase-like flavin-dependent oxidoreductase (luciferase family)
MVQISVLDLSPITLGGTACLERSWLRSLGCRTPSRRTSPPPVDPDRFHAALTPIERADLQRTQASAVVGSPETVQAGVADFIGRTSPDELIVTGQIFDHTARLYSYEILKDVAVRPTSTSS